MRFAWLFLALFLSVAAAGKHKIKPQPKRFKRPMPLPQAATEEELKWQPGLDYDTDGCFNMAAIDENGTVSKGNPQITARAELCRTSSSLDMSNAYSRRRCNHGWCVYIYNYYFEQDTNVADAVAEVFSFGTLAPALWRKKHDWESLAVWVKDGEAKFVGSSSHGKYEVRRAEEAVWDATHVKAVYHKAGDSSHSFRFAFKKEEHKPDNRYDRWFRSALVGYEGYPQGVREKLFLANFNGKQMAINDKNFAKSIVRYRPMKTEGKCKNKDRRFWRCRKKLAPDKAESDSAECEFDPNYHEPDEQDFMFDVNQDKPVPLQVGQELPPP